MKKELVIGVSALGCLLSPGNLFAEEVSHFVAKTSLDLFWINSETEHGGTKADTDGTLVGGTLSLGFISSALGPQKPGLIQLDLSKKTGDYETNFSDTGFSGWEVERNDSEMKVIYQYLGETFQPLFGLGYQKFELDAGEYSWKDDVDIFMFGGGCGINLGQAGGFSFNTKGEFYFLTGQGEETSGSSQWDLDTSGYLLKLTGQIVYSFEVDSNDVTSFGMFMEPGYQIQEIENEFPAGNSADWTYSGFYIRMGLYGIF